jgi:hypothetical protein
MYESRVEVPSVLGLYYSACGHFEATADAVAERTVVTWTRTSRKH